MAAAQGRRETGFRAGPFVGSVFLYPWQGRGSRAPESQGPWSVPGRSKPDRPQEPAGAGCTPSMPTHGTTGSSAALAAFMGPHSVGTSLAGSYRCLSRASGCRRAGRVGERGKEGPAQPRTASTEDPSILEDPRTLLQERRERGVLLGLSARTRRVGEVGHSTGGRLSPARSPVCTPRALPNSPPPRPQE